MTHEALNCDAPPSTTTNRQLTCIPPSQSGVLLLSQQLCSSFFKFTAQILVSSHPGLDLISISNDRKHPLSTFRDENGDFR